MTRRKFTAEEKVVILKKHLLEGQPVSDVCDAQELNPTQFADGSKSFLKTPPQLFLNILR